MTRSFPFAVLAVSLWFPFSAQAASTQWQDLGGGEARLSANVDPASGKVSGVVEIRLKPGWKTYWREPGGSGIPPIFDFSKSENFAGVEVAYPAPKLLKSGSSEFAGYDGPAAFPFEGSRPNPRQGGALRLELLAGVCEEICIPAQVSFEIGEAELNQSDPRTETLVAMARLNLPGEPNAQFKVESVVVLDKTLTISALVPQSDQLALFAQGPSGWYMALPKLSARSENRAEFTVEMTGQPKGFVASGQQFRFTLVAGSRAIEQSLTAQ